MLINTGRRDALGYIYASSGSRDLIRQNLFFPMAILRANIYESGDEDTDESWFLILSL